jgi:hypothetical protein
MTIRKTLEQANAEKGYSDIEKYDSLADADIERMIADDPDLAPPNRAARAVAGCSRHSPQARVHPAAIRGETLHPARDPARLGARPRPHRSRSAGASTHPRQNPRACPPRPRRPRP